MKRKKTTGVVTKPILSNTFNSRAQMDLIDMQSLSDGEWKWIMVYQDHFTKFVSLRPQCLLVGCAITEQLNGPKD